ncbi:unnamed protein product [Mytilus coruscus]|uniref:Tc1-like transposase DDE domain-containing protein n=1 Tax=Mytilus coruscus TaxID=42192 RepID=A0A6J8AGP8_MYTCO|nr:unnamed protein product [Mytilus coruscus]
MVRDANKVKRVAFAKENITNNDNFDNIIFTDECSVQLHDNKIVIYRERDSVAPVLPKPKHPLKHNINWWDNWPAESPDFNPIKMVWSMMKSRLSKKEPRTKEDLINGIKSFWREDMTIAICKNFIDHFFKVMPIPVVIGERATGDLPKKISREIKRKVPPLF